MRHHQTTAAIALAPVSSSSIAAIGHDPETNTLHVEFTSGKTYAYDGVDAAEHAALLAAPSIGAHFGKRIRPLGGRLLP